MSRNRKQKQHLAQDSGSRLGVTRRPLMRIYEIHSAIVSRSYPNCSTLAEKLSVQPKTVMRDITFMRDELKLPVRYNEALHGYFYEDDVTHFPVFQTSAEELAGLFLARTALASVRGTPLAAVMDQAFAKLTRGMVDQISFSWSDLDEAFSRKVVEQNPRDVQRFGKIAEAIMNKNVMTFFYHKLGAADKESRRVHPLHLGEVDGGWYLIAHDTDRGALRTFALPRMSRVAVLNNHFNRPKDFDGEKLLRQSFGIWNVAGDHSRQLVRVELKNYAARLAQERRWHPTQEVIPLNAKATKVEIRFEVGRLEEVLRWVLSFGSRAKVLAPAELTRMVRAEVKAMGGS